MKFDLVNRFRFMAIVAGVMSLLLVCLYAGQVHTAQ
jgi:hypothetical protein